MVKGVHVPARITHPATVGEFRTLEDYQAGVGGLIESLHIPLLGTALYFNEEGRIRELEPNIRATFLWWFHEPGSRLDPMLVGDIVILGMPNEDGESADLPAGLVDLFTRRGTFRVEVQPGEHDEWIPADRLPEYEYYFDAVTWGMIYNERRRPYALKVAGDVGLDTSSLAEPSVYVRDE